MKLSSCSGSVLAFLSALTAGAPVCAQSTQLISARRSVEAADASSRDGQLSADGRYLVFTSGASNLVPNDTNLALDVFVRDVGSGRTVCVSVDPAGAPRGGRFGRICGNGRYVVFSSVSPDLVANDVNGKEDVFVRDLLLGLTRCASVDSAGVQGNQASHSAVISRDGRRVAFQSLANNLVSGDTNSVSDIFVHDMLTASTVLVSRDSSGGLGTGYSERPQLSADGRWVVFDSDSPTLVGGDTNLVIDVFVHDLLTGLTERASLASSGAQGDLPSRTAWISDDGRFVLFDSASSTLVPGDLNSFTDAFVRDLWTGQTTRVSVDSAGVEGNGPSSADRITADGRYVLFSSDASNFAPGDLLNGHADVFLRDQQTGAVILVSANSGGAPANGDSGGADLAPDGSRVLIDSFASDLVPNDANGALEDVFLRDVNAATTELLVWGGWPGRPGNLASERPSLSSDGRYVAFQSAATNLVDGDTNGRIDVFLRDRQQGTTERVNVQGAGAQTQLDCTLPCLSGDGSVVAYETLAPVQANDSNGKVDVYARDLLQAQNLRVSVAAGGGDANGDSSSACLSGDGRLVAFQSTATNLVAGDTNLAMDVFVRDLQAGTTSRVSVASGGAQADGPSESASISADGRFVAFQSDATNLVAGDTNDAPDVFVCDRQSGLTTRISVDSSGNEGDGASSAPSISADGRFVGFTSSSSNLVAGDTNGAQDAFVHDRQTGITIRVSVDSLGNQGSGPTFLRALSADGRVAALESFATNLVAGDTNGVADVFTHDLVSGATERVSIDASGAQSNGASQRGALSGDGRYVVFATDATSLFDGDTNNARDIVLRDRQYVSPFTSICFGDGTQATPCPCGNNGLTGHGCENSIGSGGAQLLASEVPAFDGVHLTSSGELPSALSVVLQGSLELAGVVFGDGVRCAGGALKRLYLKNASLGVVSVPAGGDLPIHSQSALLGDPIAPGSTRVYQVYYRDPSASFCAAPQGNTWNVSNGVRVAW